MIEHILKIYGINCKNKWIGYFTTGLTLSIFSSLVIPVIYANNSSNKTNEFFYKLLMSTLCASKILNYWAVKYNSDNIFDLNYKLKKRQKKRSIGELNINIYSVISINLSIVISLVVTKFDSCAPFLMEIHKDFIQTMKSIFIPVTPYIFLMAIYIYSWFIVIQLLYIEIKARYLTVIKDFTNEVKSIKTKPDKSVIISTQRSILKFAEFKDNIKKYVDFLEFGIFIDLVLPVTIVVGSYESILELECWTFGISFVVLVIGSYIWTISYNLRVKRSESDLTLNLNRWLNPNIENGDEIELKVLKKAAMHFSEQKFIDEFNSA